MPRTALSSPALSMRRLVFQNFDDENVFNDVEKYFMKPDALNLVIEFDNTTAHVASDLDVGQVKNVLETESRGGVLPTRWISIWAPERQTDILKAIGARYQFSPRLLGLMCADPSMPTPVLVTPDTPRSFRDMFHSQKEPEQTCRQSQASDPESQLEKATQPEKEHELDLSHYKIVNEVWHYSSIDWGHKFLCVGYNSLFNIHTGKKREYAKQNHPEGKRLWTWLILCDDGTVISIHENPFPRHQDPPNPQQVEELKVIRFNTLNVFRQLSKANTVQSPIMTLFLRNGPQPHEDTPETNPASLLFYYLFDDWHTSYSLVARSQHRYGEQLEELRKNMFVKASLDNIDRLHHIGRQLSTLKRIYQSYATIIDSIRAAQRPVHPAADVSVSQVLPPQKSAPDPSVTADTTLGVALASVAIMRFARLRDRITLYALSEIQECLDEKESLVFLNFNLIALKESQAVERLTRITILLAKVTILFLPVSLLTAYFSASVLVSHYTPAHYWVAFCVIVVVSFAFLALFGKASGTVEGRAVYSSLSQIGWEWVRKGRGRGKG